MQQAGYLEDPAFTVTAEALALSGCAVVLARKTRLRHIGWWHPPAADTAYISHQQAVTAKIALVNSGLPFLDTVREGTIPPFCPKPRRASPPPAKNSANDRRTPADIGNDILVQGPSDVSHGAGQTCHLQHAAIQGEAVRVSTGSGIRFPCPGSSGQIGSVCRAGAMP
jgi:hypothetical protein